MPIRREHRWFYPIDWPQLSAVIRFRCAQGRCESCGRPHGRLVCHLGDAPPQRPAEKMIEHYAGRTLQAADELADLAHAEGDQRSRLSRPLLCDVTALSFTRRARGS